MCGFFGHADQFVVPTKRQFSNSARSLSPLSAISPAPLLLTNSQLRKRTSRIVLSSASMSKPAPGALTRAARPVWLNLQLANE
jgi:hypothetical protein